MALREVLTYPHPALREMCAPVVAFDQRLRSLVEDMFLTMYAHGGIGLAASQIGVLERVAVVDVSSDQSQKLVLINPEITERLGSVSSEEGCLSIPEYRDSIKRSERIKVSAQDLEGNSQEISAEGLLAICIQHEIDHLNGTLFVDHLSRLKREFFKRWVKKQGIA
jgi:peptide deformylase